MDQEKIEAGEPASATSPPQKTRPRILVVEKDSDIGRLNAEVLMGSGYQVDVVDNGLAAWEALQQKNYDLMVTEYELPNLTGIDLLKKLHSVRRALPVIMASATLPKEEFRQTPWLHPAAMLRKPYTIGELLGRVQDVLRATDESRERSTPSSDPHQQPPNQGWLL